MKEVKTINIGGIDFEVVENIVIEFKYMQLWEAYKRPNAKKKHIWQSWCDWFYKFSGSKKDYMHIGTKYNNAFTIVGIITANARTYRFYITPQHNYIKEI